jgi:hypothetical protein
MAYTNDDDDDKKNMDFWTVQNVESMKKKLCCHTR